MKISNILFVFVLFLYAKEYNWPFVPPQSIQNDKFKPFDKTEFTFNSDSRILSKISLEYITLDGATHILVVDINKSIDWHDTYVLSTKESPSATTILDVSATIPEKQITDEFNVSTQLDFPANNGKLEEFISFASFVDRIKINTQDEIIGEFIVGDPSKIVLDFQRDVAFVTKNIKLGSGTAFKRMSLGAHKGYYRLVIYTDGKYNYRIEKDASGYTLHLI